MVDSGNSGRKSGKLAVKLAAKVFTVIAMLLLLVPSVGMLWARTDSSTENTSLSAFPSLHTDDGSLNNGFLAQFGEWFDDHYAYRNQLLDCNSYLITKAVATSPVEKVVYGKNGWLYFNGTLDDYQGRDLLSERELANIAHNLSLMQEYVEDRGGVFVFTIALNKNSIYGDNMPNRYNHETIANRKRIKPYLERAGICYVDLKETLAKAQEQNSDQLLYYMRDTHWNSLGARAAYNDIMVALGREHEDYLDQDPKTVSDYVGDINRILYPLHPQPETAYVFDTKEFVYLTEAKDIENDGWLVTGSDGEGTLLMFRDSFANALFPFMAGEFKTAFFSKLEPYNLANVDRFSPDCVVVERVERNLGDLGVAPAVMVAPRREVAVVEVSEGAADLGTSRAQGQEKRQGEDSDTQGVSLSKDTDGDYTVFRGVVDENLINLDDTIYLALEDSSGKVLGIYETFWVADTSSDGHISDYGFLAYLPTKDLPGSYKTSILVGKAGGTTAFKVF